MTNDLNQSLYFEDEIDLKEIFKILIESKKLLISTILIFTTASIIYSLSLKPSFNSSTQYEIGYVELANGARELIESPSNLVSDLRVLILKNQDDKFIQNISMNVFENKIINLELTSSSGEQNENFLTEMTSYIDQRHSNLALLSANQNKTKISQKIKTNEALISFIKAKQLDSNQTKKLTINSNLENVKSEISFIKAKQLSSIQLKQLNIEDRIARLKFNLPIIDLKISQFEKVINEDTNNLSLLKEKGLHTKRASNSPTLEQIIFLYKSGVNDLNAEKYSNILETKNLNNQLITLENSTLQSDKLFSLEQEQQTLENQLITLEDATLQSDKLFSLEQEQQTLENQLQKLMTQTQIRTRPIRNIETKTIKPKTGLTIILGLIIGFITSIFLIFIRNFVKNYKETQV
jgi:LPS O-antigen subunit length determinant protein (WzzB/FepE family)